MKGLEGRYRSRHELLRTPFHETSKLLAEGQHIDVQSNRARVLVAACCAPIT
jgi:hypothetical protein